MKRKIMIDYNWTAIVLLIIAVLCISMLAVLFIAALRMKAFADPGTLKYFDSAFLATAAEYNRTALLLSVSERFLSWAFMIAALIVVWKLPLADGRVSILTAVAVFAVFNLILYLVLLPLQYYRGFVIDHQFGISNQGLSAWFLDVLKERGLSLVINTAILTVIYILIVRLPGSWWIAASAIFVVFMILAILVFPVLIDPLFYKFTPLEDNGLKKEIEKITEKAGIKVDNFLVADASRKTNRVNAYFTGIGNTKRIVIYDNLLNKHSREEILSVIAHEVGHWKHKHILISTALGCILVFIIMFILKLFQTGFNIGSGIRLVLLLFIIYSFLSYLSMPLENYISRRFEKAADRSVIELTQNPQAQVDIFKKLAISNLSNVSPSPILKYIIYSHPPILERIKTADSE